MKVIDLYLAIKRNKNIPKEVVYKYKTYRYFPEYKQYYREEYGDMISLFLEATMGDKVYLIEDTPKEDKKIKRIEERESGWWPNSADGNVSTLKQAINEIIDRLNGEEDE